MNSLSYKKIKFQLDEYNRMYSDIFTEKQTDLFNELVYKIDELERLTADVDAILPLCISERSPLITTSGNKDVLRFGNVQIALNRANPDVPVSQAGISAGAPKKMLSDNERKLLSVTEAFYEKAHRVIDICRELFELNSFKCKSISIVRNQLIVHSESSGITYDSFGFTDKEGPVIKALRKNDQQQFKDKGFYKNAASFILTLENLIESRIQ